MFYWWFLDQPHDRNQFVWSTNHQLHVWAFLLNWALTLYVHIFLSVIFSLNYSIQGWSEDLKSVGSSILIRWCYVTSFIQLQVSGFPAILGLLLVCLFNPVKKWPVGSLPGLKFVVLHGQLHFFFYILKVYLMTLHCKNLAKLNYWLCLSTFYKSPSLYYVSVGLSLTTLTYLNWITLRLKHSWLMLTGAKVIHLCEEVDGCERTAALLMKELLSFSFSILDVIE